MNSINMSLFMYRMFFKKECRNKLATNGPSFAFGRAFGKRPGTAADVSYKS